MFVVLPLILKNNLSLEKNHSKNHSLGSLAFWNFVRTNGTFMGLLYASI